MQSPRIVDPNDVSQGRLMLWYTLCGCGSSGVSTVFIPAGDPAPTTAPLPHGWQFGCPYCGC